MKGVVTSDRNEFLKLAGQYAMTQDLKYAVMHKGMTFYPVAYMCGYDIGDPKPFHKVIVHDMHANSIKQVPLSEVEPYVKEA